MRGNQSFNVILSVGARAILLLLQHLHRMHNEKLLTGGEVEDFEKYVKATGGKFDIVNVPVAEGQEAALEEFKQNLSNLKVRYHILPDLDGADKRIQICVYQPDAGRFASCFKDYIQKQYGTKVSNLDIAQVKRKCGIIERENYNFPKTEGNKVPQCSPEKEKLIIEAWRY